MKPAFILNAANGLESSLVSVDAQPSVREGMRVTVTRDLLLLPHATVRAGEGGTVDFVDSDSGTVEILLDQAHRGLVAWFNHIMLVPFVSEDIVSGVACIPGCACLSIAA